MSVSETLNTDHAHYLGKWWNRDGLAGKPGKVFMTTRGLKGDDTK